MFTGTWSLATSSDPPCKAENARLTTVPLKELSKHDILMSIILKTDYLLVRFSIKLNHVYLVKENRINHF